MSGILLIKDKHTGNTIFSIDCEPHQVRENIDRVIEFEIYDFVSTYDGKPVDGAVPPDWMDRHADKIEAGLSFAKFIGWTIAGAIAGSVIVIAAAWFLAWPVEVSGQ